MKTDELTGKYEVEEDDANGLAMAGNGYETRVKDESSDKKYFTITPRIVKSYSRNSHDFSVWDTIKDIAGESGECFLNTTQIAILSGCSTGQVSNSRKYWIKLGFLKGQIRKDPGYSQAVWHLTVPDIWQKNVEWCEKYPKIADRLAFRVAHRSLHRVKPSPSEGKPSPSETKKNLIKKNKEREIEIFNALEKLTGSLSTDTPRYVDTWLEKHSCEWVLKAIDEARANGARSVKYIDKILISWEANGYPKTRDEQVQAARKDKNANHKGIVETIKDTIYTAADIATAERIKARRAGL